MAKKKISKKPQTSPLRDIPSAGADIPAYLVKQMHASDGLAPVDLERFWADQEIAAKDPFGPDIAQVTLGVMMSGECVYDELGIAEDYWRYDHDQAWQLEMNKAYNDKAEKIVGRRLLNEKPWPAEDMKYPPVKGLADVFEAKQIWQDRSWWLMESAHNEQELTALLDRVRQKDIRKIVLPDGWDEAKVRLMKQGIKPGLYRGQRGPVTFATSIYGIENLLFLLMENVPLAERLRDTILWAMLEIARVLDEEAGYAPADAPHGWYWADDNCYLLTPDMYNFFAYPILKGIFDRYCPDEKDCRFQHSDSAMGHHLPTLGRLKLNGTNFGPTVTVADIRRHLPKAVIDGQLAPFTFCRNDEEGIVREFLRDFAEARAARGLRFNTAGSINNGSRLTGMRLIMSAIQNFGRY